MFRILGYLMTLCLAVPSAVRATEPVRVVALHGVLEEFARRIGGDAVSVECLVPAGTDLHGFSPAPADVRRIEAAELVLATGFELEPWLGKLVRNSGTKALVFEASEAIRERVLSASEEHAAGEGAHDHEHGEYDPHWWHSLRAATDVARGICVRLTVLRPGERDGFAARLAMLEAEFAELSRWAEKTLERLPAERRHLVTSHDAFGYLARDLRFVIHPLNGVNPDAEADARSLAKLIDFVSKNKIRAIFPDNTENPRVLAAMTRETGARLGGTLYADGLGGKGGPAADFAAMYRYNLSTIVSGLSE